MAADILGTIIDYSIGGILLLIVIIVLIKMRQVSHGT